MNRFQTAMEIQDACNLRAIARELVKAVDQAATEGGTDASYRDPAVVLLVGKIESLVHSSTRFDLAWDQCASKAIQTP